MQATFNEPFISFLSIDEHMLRCTANLNQRQNHKENHKMPDFEWIRKGCNVLVSTVALWHSFEIKFETDDSPSQCNYNSAGSFSMGFGYLAASLS